MGKGTKVAGLGLIVGAGLAVGWWRWGGDTPSTPSGLSTPSATVSSAKTAIGSSASGSGTVSSPTALPAGHSSPSASAAATTPPADPFDYGTLPKVRGDANVQVKSVVEAIKTQSHPERVSLLMAPKPFDPEAYRTNPQAYLDVVEPGRVFQPAQPGKDVPRIAARSPYYQQILQGQSTVLQVQATAGMPVTFTSTDTGMFENQLTSQTVQADEQGRAQVRFLATTGTIEDVNILAASPVCSGQVKFLVNVTKPGWGQGVVGPVSQKQ